MFGWFRRAADWASRRKRLWASASAPRLGEMVLMATKRLRMGSWALYTTPMEPRPSSWRTLYLPIASNSTCKGLVPDVSTRVIRGIPVDRFLGLRSREDVLE